MIGMHQLVFEKVRFVFPEESEHFHFLAISVNRFCNAVTLSRKVTIQRCNADKNLLTETIIAEIEKVFSKRNRVCLFYRDDPYKSALFDNFRVSVFRPQESKTILNSRVAK